MLSITTFFTTLFWGYVHKIFVVVPSSSNMAMTSCRFLFSLSRVLPTLRVEPVKPIKFQIKVCTNSSIRLIGSSSTTV